MLNYVVCFLLGNIPASELYIRTFGTFYLYRQVGAHEDGGVPKRRHIKFRRREITQKENNI
jgi:hypothetical protein